MKEIKLFVDFEFTSLSPDAQPISVGIVCENKAFITPVKDETQDDIISNFCVGSFRQDFSSNSFYAEFTDFDISRCDDWVKENVVSKLHVGRRFNKPNRCINTYNWECSGNIESSKFLLNEWLKQFSDYKIQFVVDCGTWDWYWLLQLLAEWDITDCYDMLIIPDCNLSDEQKKEISENWSVVSGSSFIAKSNNEPKETKQGLPKLHSNVSPVPMDLNDLIAFKKGISVSEAFDLNREELASGVHSDVLCAGGVLSEDGIHPKKHNALWDAKVIKAIYEQLNS